MTPRTPKRRPAFVPDPFWTRIAQLFVGLFFVAAAYFKLTDSFFGARIVPLATDINYWLDAGFTMKGYDAFLRFMLPYADVLAGIVIFCQATVGVLLIYNKKVRWAGVVLLFVQTNILLSSFHGFGFIVFSGVAIWLGLLYFFRDSMTPRKWALLTFVLILIGFKYQEQRWIMGDQWLSSFPGQYDHFQMDIMSVHPVLKQWVMNLVDAYPDAVSWWWAGSWWLHTAALFLMFTRYRLYAGYFWLLIWVQRSLVWTTGVTGEGTLYTLVLFTWVTFEEYMQQSRAPGWLVPSRDTLLWPWRRLTRKKKKR